MNGELRIYGAGENRVSWISLYDVARFAASAASDAVAPQAKNAVIEIVRAQTVAGLLMASPPSIQVDANLANFIRSERMPQIASREATIAVASDGSLS